MALSDLRRNILRYCKVQLLIEPWYRLVLRRFQSLWHTFADNALIGRLERLQDCA